MKKEQLSDAFNMLDEAIIEETAKIRNRRGKRVKRLAAWGAAAACLALLTYAGLQALPQLSPGASAELPLPSPSASAELPLPSPSASTELPLLTLSENNSDGMGWEAYLAYDVSELVNGNPWNEAMELATLPVYRNRLALGYRFNAAGVEYTEVDFDEVRDFLLDIAERLNLDTSALTITDNAPDGEHRQNIINKHEQIGETVPEEYFNPTALIIQTDGIKIEVDQTLTALITFDPPAALPDGYNYSFYSPYEDNVETAEYLKEEYAQFIDMESPQTNIYDGDYDFYLNQSYHIGFYEGAGDDISRIINYNFNQIVFYSSSEEGKLRLVRVYHPDLSLKLGDYPIVTADAAKELLLSGHYITSVPHEVPGRESIKRVELVYHTGNWDQYFIPFYRFYVEVDDLLPHDLDETGIKIYGIYYVPAVEGRYLTNMPIWDGSIN